MKVNTDFGIQEIKPQKIFEWQSIKFAIIKRPEKYLTTKETPLVMLRIVEYTTTQALPITIQKGCTLKQIERKTVEMLDKMETVEELKARIEKETKYN